MTGISAPRPCEGCEYAGQGVAATGDTQSVIRITEEGVIFYAGSAYSECGLGMGHISPEDAWTDNQELVARIDACEAPVSEVVDVPVKWPIGLLGFTKQAEVRSCPAIRAGELEQIVEAHVADCKSF